jgi:O-acetyl-ADP-ribose deacetylase (regulator of RNase III)
MSFEIRNGDLFANVKEGHIVHGCNAQGVMGSGVAKIVREMYPEAYKAYTQRYCNEGLRLGEFNSVEVAPGLMVHNAITQEFYGTDKRHVYYPAVYNTLRMIAEYAETNPIPCSDVHFPLIGGGLAGGDKDLLLDLYKRVFHWTDAKGILWIYP